MSLSSSLNCSHFAQFAQHRSGLLKFSHISLVLLTERAIEHMSEQIYERASERAYEQQQYEQTIEHMSIGVYGQESLSARLSIRASKYMSERAREQTYEGASMSKPSSM